MGITDHSSYKDDNRAVIKGPPGDQIVIFALYIIYYVLVTTSNVNGDYGTIWCGIPPRYI